MGQRESDVPRTTPPENDLRKAHYFKPNGVLGRERELTILSVSANPEDHDSLRCIMQDRGWRIICASSGQQATACLCHARVDVIVCDCLPDGTWRDILSCIAELTEPAAVIVTSATTDEVFRTEVRSLGGFDVLSKPLDPAEVQRLVTAAWRNRAVPAETPVPA